MTRTLPALMLLAAIAALCVPALGSAVTDLSITSERDEKRNTVYYLVNRGSRTIKVKVEAEKFCSGVANTQKPVVREYWIRPDEKVKLGLSWSRSTCRRSYRIIEAQYY